MTRARPTRFCRPAFTLLETMMAALIGGAILIAVAGVFAAIEGMDSRMQARFLASAELQRTRIVVGRAMDTLLMSSEPQRSAEASDGEQHPARLLLEAEDASAVTRATQRARMTGAGRLEAPQRLEVVLKQWPLPPELARERSAAARALPRATEIAPPEPGVALRCAFELRPDRDGTWTLWWRPLPLPEAGGRPAREADPAADPNAVPLISRLTKCRWTAFDNRKREPAIKAVWATELPAYVELEIQTAAGPGANWMFEVAWASGKEFADEAGAAGEETAEGVTNGTSGAPGTTSGRPQTATPRGRRGPGGRP